DYTAVGDTTNLAARMQQAARPGSVVIGEATHAAVEGYFETLDLGEVPAKGRAPARAFEVLRARGGRARLDIAAERGLTPLVDRLRQNFGIEELDGEPEIIAKVEHGMRRLGALDAHIPFIRYLLAVDAGDPTLTRMDAANRRTKIFEAVRALSLRGAARR